MRKIVSEDIRKPEPIDTEPPKRNKDPLDCPTFGNDSKESEPKTTEHSPKKEESKVEEEMEEDASIYLVHYTKEESELGEHVRTYLEQVPENIRHSFYSQEAFLQKLSNGYNRIVLNVLKGRTQVGLVAFHQDHNASNEYRIYIRHLSVTSLDLFPQVIEAVLEHIWQNHFCTHIRIELLHQKQENGGFKVDPDVKKLFAGNGFKWKTLSNDPVTGLRA